MITNDTEFHAKHCTLMQQVANLPFVRAELIEAEKKYEMGFIGNAVTQRDNYDNCVRWINQLMKEMK